MNRKAVSLKILPLLVMFLAGLAIAAQAQEDDGKTVVAMVLRINGSLEFRDTASADWTAAKPKQPLYNGNQVRTGIGNRAVIVYMSSGTRVLVNENTELEIQVQTPPGKFQKPASERTKLLIGEVYSTIREKKPEGYSYEVETPSSVASVRGTEFNATYENGQASYLSLLNAVEIMNQLGSVLLQQYQQTTVPDGNAPTDPQQLTKKQAEEQTKWRDEVDPTWKLNLVPQGGTRQATGQPFTLTVWAESAESGGIDVNAAFQLSAFGSSSETAEFSADGGKTWTSSPTVTLSNGQMVLQARNSAAETFTVTASAANCEPASVSLQTSVPKARRTLEIRFADPDGSNEETLIFEMEEK